MHELVLEKRGEDKGWTVVGGVVARTCHGLDTVVDLHRRVEEGLDVPRAEGVQNEGC